MSEYISKQEINRVLLNRIDMNNKCLSGARESKHFEEEKYFSTLIFEDEQIASLIEELSSADVRPNIHGHWEEDSKEGFHHCSKCGQIIFSCQKWFKCCPKCMAVMDEKPFKNCHKTKCEACIYHGHCDREDMREPKGEKGTE